MIAWGADMFSSHEEYQNILKYYLQIFSYFKKTCTDQSTLKFFNLSESKRFTNLQK